jgi:hypothetical protein
MKTYQRDPFLMEFQSGRDLNSKYVDFRGEKPFPSNCDYPLPFGLTPTPNKAVEASSVGPLIASSR